MDEVPKEPFKNIRFVFVDNVREVFREALKDKTILPQSSDARLPTRLPQVASDRAGV